MDQQKSTSYPKEKISILLLENISDTAVAEFTAAGYNVRKLAGALSEEELIKEVKEVHLLGIRSKTQVTRKVLAAAKKLQAIGCFCIGTNQVDLKAATQHGVAVFNAPYSNTRSVAELVIGLSIILIRRIVDKNAAAHNGIWMKEATGSYELRGKTLGIIGYGNIGSQVSVLAEGLGLNVIYYDAETKLPLGNAVQYRTLKEVFEQADIISLHVPSNKATANMINQETLSYVKKGAIFLNYARGEVVDLEALKDALESGQLSGAAIDVFPVEPEKNGAAFNTPLQKLSNVILTPHIGGSTEEAQHNIGLDVSSKMLNYLEKGASFGSHSVPAISVPPIENTHRILHVHENVPGVLSAINTALSENKINILGQYLKTNDQIGYVVLDVDRQLSQEAAALLKNVKHTIKTRLLY
ncbi:phosphoglycerate dehydrogenase [Chitinophaga nivalis]|uniref:D-3-phosphoglycerate dehydrogenase n=1 Tax=Chitinophaga nivalis TaxID=2991709 RepID=A0ABT3IM48_9BACT|nr:phosphoglycerate dehydrogenase [Chitinophaga nivalis]MCW3465453.1 phosphoglycerate dehydrogenase [Chitinophaga nivalis]MCW3484855.1 phosphoglycerate dehydrogenase [Chitinophaga nivalis]